MKSYPEKTTVAAVSGLLLAFLLLWTTACANTSAADAGKANAQIAATSTPGARATAAGTSMTTASALHLTSPDFKDDGMLSKKNEANSNGCTGGNTPPTLQWTNVPSAAKSLALTMTDVDAAMAGGFHHWIVYNIPTNITMLSSKGSSQHTTGTNSARQAAYMGPCPPRGANHHFVFTLYALSVDKLPAGQNYDQLISKITNDIKGASSIIATYRRS